MRRILVMGPGRGAGMFLPLLHYHSLFLGQSRFTDYAVVPVDCFLPKHMDQFSHIQQWDRNMRDIRFLWVPGRRIQVGDLQEDEPSWSVSAAFGSRRQQVRHGVCVSNQPDMGSATHNVHPLHCWRGESRELGKTLLMGLRRHHSSEALLPLCPKE